MESPILELSGLAKQLREFEADPANQAVITAHKALLDGLGAKQEEVKLFARENNTQHIDDFVKIVTTPKSKRWFDWETYKKLASKSDLKIIEEKATTTVVQVDEKKVAALAKANVIDPTKVDAAIKEEAMTAAVTIKVFADADEAEAEKAKADAKETGAENTKPNDEVGF